MVPMEFGIIGLGKMGGNLSMQAREKGIRVVGMDVKPKPDLINIGIEVVTSIQELVTSLRHPRIILLYIPAGPAVDQVIDELLIHLETGDIIVDGGNSHWGDSIRRYEYCKEYGLQYVDCGTSGGLAGARQGACFMVGGDPETVDLVQPILKELAVPEGFIYAGPSGAGHYVKLVHNAIEFGMLQAIGEGAALLKQSPFAGLDVAAVFTNWNFV